MRAGIVNTPPNAHWQLLCGSAGGYHQYYRVALAARPPVFLTTLHSALAGKPPVAPSFYAMPSRNGLPHLRVANIERSLLLNHR